MQNRLLDFVSAMSALCATGDSDEARTLEQAGALLSALVTHDDWLPDVMAQPHPQHYQQHLLYIVYHYG